MHVIFTELPPKMKNDLARLCFGIPDAKWTQEQDLFLALRTYVSPLPDSLIEALHTLHHEPFPVQLSGVDVTVSKQQAPFVFTSPLLSSELTAFCKKIDNLIRMPSTHPPHVFLGSFPKTSLPKLPNYKEAFHFYSSHPFTLQRFMLGELHITPKNRILSVIDIYPLHFMN